MALRRIDGQIAIVTGASRGIGRGIALQLAEHGATVYITGRTLTTTDGQPGSLQQTADEISNRGGKCIPVQCDHANDKDVQDLFDRVNTEQNGRLDILVNNAFNGAKVISENITVPFWEQDLDNWDIINNVGLRNHFRCAALASKMMVPQKQGLIVNISSVGGLRYLFNVPYGVGKAAKDRMAQDCALELVKHDVTMVSLWPGAVQTEHMMSAINDSERFTKVKDGDKLKKAVENGETVEFTGKAIVALAGDKNRIKKTGRTHIVADLASEYGFTDINGRQPPNMRSIKTLLNYNGNTWLAACTPSFINIPKWQFSLAGLKF